MTNMKRALSLLLVVLMTLSLLPLASFAADGSDGGTSGGTSYKNGVVTTKTYDPETGKLTLEAYATGESVTTITTKPADIVLVLDVSGSMDDPIISYTEVYEILTKNTYYYKDSRGRYREAYYCGTCRAWYNDEHYNFFGHQTPGAKLTPRTSADDTSSTYTQFYTRTSVKKIAALKDAVNAFIDGVAAKSSDSKIAIVKFAGDKTNRIGNDTYSEGYYTYNYTQIVENLTAVNAAGQTTLKNAVNALRPAGATSADYGMQLANTLITNESSERSQVVVMFTDGEPNHDYNFDSTVAGNAIAASKRIKDKGATVYTIGVFGNSIDDNVHRYMNLVSSNYPQADGWNGNPTDTKAHDYYKTAEDGQQLLEIFKEISQEVGGAKVELTSETVLKDVISGDFMLPNGASDIKIYTQELNSLHVDEEGRYDDWKDRVDVTNKPVIFAIVGKTITVTGFDYSDNWVGSHSDQAGGKKLVLEIDIVLDPNGTGTGTVPTNGADSGLYVDGKPVKDFPVPETYIPFYTIHHVQGGNDVEQTKHRIGPNENLSARVTDGFLYGGAFTDPDCKIPAFSNGAALDFAPKDGAVYYIWEVGKQYLRAQDYDVWRPVQGAAAGTVSVVNLYMLTSIDRLMYQEVGFIVDGVSYPAEEKGVSEAYGVVDVYQSGNLYDEIYVKDGVINTIHGQKATGNDTGYIACLSLKDIKPNFFTKDRRVTFEPYWITKDGVKVTGYRTRTSVHRGEGPETIMDPNNPNYPYYKFVNSQSSNKDPVCTAAETPAITSMLSFSPVYVINNDVDPIDPVDPVDPFDPPVEEGITVTVVDNGAVYEVPVEAGDITGRISYAGAEGMLFAGWYTDELYTAPADFTNVQQSMTVYARYVSDAYLQVAYKKLEGWFGVSSLTLISAIDGRNYRETGFIVNGQTMVVSEYTGGSRPGFGFGGWSGFGFGGFGLRESASDYFDGVAADALLMKQMVPVWNLSRGDTLEITPYWVTMDGTTVTGTPRTLTYTGRSITG